MKEDWISELEREVRAHPALHHMLLARLATGPYTRADYQAFALQHYALVGFSARCLELLLLRAPAAVEKSWLVKILANEYGDGSELRGEGAFYRRFLRAAGVADGDEVNSLLSPAVWAFVEEHLEICREDSFLVGVGALGPGHEWALPTMFGHLLPGLRRAGFRDDEISYFQKRVNPRSNGVRDSLAAMVRTPAQRVQVRRGALRSLGARFDLWTGIERAMVSVRQPESVRAVRAGLFGPQRGGEVFSTGTLDELRRSVSDFVEGGQWPRALARRKRRSEAV